MADFVSNNIWARVEILMFFWGRIFFTGLLRPVGLAVTRGVAAGLLRPVGHAMTTEE